MSDDTGANIRKSSRLQDANEPTLEETMNSTNPPNRVISSFGLYGQAANEKIPTIIPIRGEQTITNPTLNCRIAFIKDTPMGDTTGVGSEGGTNTDTIDIVAGSLVGAPIMDKNKASEIIGTRNPFADAARIYISSKSNIDKTFGIAPGIMGEQKYRSTVLAKADLCRVVGTQGVKIITGGARNATGTGGRGELSSNMDELTSGATIELNAGNYSGAYTIRRERRPGETLIPLFESISYLQPTVMGDNIHDCIKDIHSDLQDICEIMITFSQVLSGLFRDLAIEGTLPAVVGKPTLPIVAAACARTNFELKTRVCAPLYRKEVAISMIGSDYLEPSGNKYIKSRNVFTT